jgi:putative flippase GtrA
MLNIYHKNLILKKIFNKNKDFIKYFFVGGLSALADFIIFAAFYYIIKNWFISGLISFCIATFLNYYLSIKFVFESGKRLRKSQEVFLVYLISFIGFTINQSILFLMIEKFNLNVYLSKIATTSIIFIWNFNGRKYFVFLKKINRKI